MAIEQKGIKPEARQPPAGATAPEPTVEALRGEIDSGATAEKVANPDPAAAPLGADAEASGNPPSREARRLETQARKPLRARAERQGRGFGTFVVVGSVFGIALIAIALALG